MWLFVENVFMIYSKNNPSNFLKALVFANFRPQWMATQLVSYYIM